MANTPKVWFTADWHFGHHLMVEKYRPYSSLNEMDDVIIESMAAVRPADRLYVLGDISFRPPIETSKLLGRINGQKYLIIGNHDKRINSPEINRHFIWMKDLESIKIDGQRVVMCHYPMLSWYGSSRGAWMLHGHCHGNLKTDRLPPAKRIDVGWDVWNRPLDLVEIAAIMATITSEPIDHHLDNERSSTWISE